MKPLALAVAVALIGTAACASARSSGPTDRSVAPTSSACNEKVATTVRLGGTGSDLPGNSTPVHVIARAGTTVRVAARFGERTLAFPATSSANVRVLCHARSGWTYATVFRLTTPGIALVTTHTSTCPPCAQLGFATSITVRAE